jgi:hypothetical protein
MSGVWYPPPRSTRTGHRVSVREGWRPVETRRMPVWPWWPLEILSRVAARKVGKRKLPIAVVLGIEREEEH